MPGKWKTVWPTVERREVVHAVRTTLAAVASLLFARLFKMPEAYWAAITTMIVMQSTLGAALTISRHRLVGTALGASMGALTTIYLGRNVACFGLVILVLGLICALLHLERTAYRYAGITATIVMLVVRSQAVWIIAMHRFIEISIGIVIVLAATALWPEQRAASK